MSFDNMKLVMNLKRTLESNCKDEIRHQIEKMQPINPDGTTGLPAWARFDGVDERKLWDIMGHVVRGKMPPDDVIPTDSLKDVAKKMKKGFIIDVNVRATKDTIREKGIPEWASIDGIDPVKQVHMMSSLISGENCIPDDMEWTEIDKAFYTQMIVAYHHALAAADAVRRNCD